MLPAFGSLAVAFRTGNPGAWLFHCHVVWHTAQGLSVQFLESGDSIESSMDLSHIEPECQAWSQYTPSDPFSKGDSGI
jgi:hypothetical protein